MPPIGCCGGGIDPLNAVNCGLACCTGVNPGTGGGVVGIGPAESCGGLPPPNRFILLINSTNPWSKASGLNLLGPVCKEAVGCIGAGGCIVDPGRTLSLRST